MLLLFEYALMAGSIVAMGHGRPYVGDDVLPVVVRSAAVGVDNSRREPVRRHWCKSHETSPEGRQSTPQTVANNSPIRVRFIRLLATAVL